MNKEKTTFQIRDLRKRLNRALRKKQELNNRIMRAIEYIKAHEVCCKINKFVLIQILEGSDKE